MKKRLLFTVSLTWLCLILQSQELPPFRVSAEKARDFEKKLAEFNQQTSEWISEISADSLCHQEMASIDSSYDVNQSVLDSSVQRFHQDKEFLMGQVPMAEWTQSMHLSMQAYGLAQSNARRLHQLSQCVEGEKLRAQINRLLKTFEKLRTQQLKVLDRLGQRLSRYIRKHPEARALQAHRKFLKLIERGQSTSVSHAQLQSKEHVLERFADKIGGTKEQAMEQITTKLSEAAPTIEKNQLQSHIKQARANFSSRRFSDRLIPRTGLHINRTSPASLDLRLGLGYQVARKLTLGMAVSQRLSLGESWEKVAIASLGWGYQTFAEYTFWRAIYLESSWERYRGQVTSTTPSVDLDNRLWRQSWLIGLGRKHKLTPRWQMSTSLHYRLGNQVSTQYPNRWTLRVGFNMSR